MGLEMNDRDNNNSRLIVGGKNEGVGAKNRAWRLKKSGRVRTGQGNGLSPARTFRTVCSFDFLETWFVNSHLAQQRPGNRKRESRERVDAR